MTKEVKKENNLNAAFQGEWIMYVVCPQEWEYYLR